MNSGAAGLLGTPAPRCQVGYSLCCREQASAQQIDWWLREKRAKVPLAQYWPEVGEISELRFRNMHRPLPHLGACPGHNTPDSMPTNSRDTCRAYVSNAISDDGVAFRSAPAPIIRTPIAAFPTLACPAHATNDRLPVSYYIFPAIPSWC